MELEILFVCLIMCSTSSARSSFDGCDKQSTFGYQYVNLYPIDFLQKKESLHPTELLELEFYVKASSDAHILLAEQNNLKDTLGYEIVIGGGKNSFSQIRLLPKETKTTQPTKDIVSALNYRGFWIKLNTLQVIMVGRIGENDPFLFWVNTRPFRISYFAFSTWNNVKGEWFFNCKDYSLLDPGYMGGEGNFTHMQRLKVDLLSFYNPTNFPQRNDYPEETIEVHLNVSHFHLDEKLGKLTLTGMALLKWIDWKLVWNSSEYDGIKEMHVSPYQIWTPNVCVMNSLAFKKEALLTISGSAAVTSNGEVFWRVPFRTTTLCLLGYVNWPFDAHNCSLLFGFWTEPLKIKLDQMDVSKLFQSEWDILKVNGRDLMISDVDDFAVIVDLYFRRREPSYEFLLLPPFWGAAVLVLVSFWLHPKSSVKLFLHCGAILILVLILMSTGNRIPPAVSTIPKIVLLYSTSIPVMCVPIILFISLKYVPQNVLLPRILASPLNSRFIEILFVLPRNPKSRTYSNLQEQEDRFISAVRLIALVERFVFMIYFIILIITFLSFLTKFEMLNF